jgi:transporter family protein
VSRLLIVLFDGFKAQNRKRRFVRTLRYNAPRVCITLRKDFNMVFDRWLIYALLSAIAASFVGIFGKLGMKGIDSNLATAIRSTVMTLFLLAVCAVVGIGPRTQTIGLKPATMIVLSGVAGAVSWLFYFKAIQLGSVSKVAPIDKLSMPFAVVIARCLSQMLHSPGCARFIS